MNGQRRAALVTGAARGLARAIIVELAAHGYRVAFTYRLHGTPPDETLRRIAAMPHPATVARRLPTRSACGETEKALAIPVDHARQGDTEAAVHAVEAAYGRIDVLVHAVGPLLTGAFVRATMASYREVIDGNLTSAVEAASAVLPGMRERRFGRLIFFGMRGSQQTIPALNMSLYAASKAAVVAFARCLALEEARHGITVNVIEPGDIRCKESDDSATRAVTAAVRFLASDEAASVSGAVLAVDGGPRRPKSS